MKGAPLERRVGAGRAMGRSARTFMGVATIASFLGVGVRPIIKVRKPGTGRSPSVAARGAVVRPARRGGPLRDDA